MILGIDVGGSSIKYGVFLGLDLIEQNQITTPQSGKDDVLLAINKLISKLTTKYEVDRVGIGFPSVVSKDYFVHIAPNIPAFINIDLKKSICDNFKNIAIKIDNDANTAALAELKFGSAINLNNFIYVTLGSGVGGAIIINKAVFEGDTFGAGEIGYTNFNFDAEINKIENRRGILEEYLGRNQFTNYFNSISNAKVNSPNDIFKLAESNNETAIKAFKYYGELLGIGLASVMNFLDIHSVVIGGGIIKAHKYIIPALEKSIEKKKLPHIKQNILVAKYLDNTGIYGAMALVK